MTPDLQKLLNTFLCCTQMDHSVVTKETMWFWQYRTKKQLDKQPKAYKSCSNCTMHTWMKCSF